MVLKLRVKISYKGKCIESIGIVNSGFAGREPEITLPETLAKELLGETPSLILIDKILADGTRTLLPKTKESLDLYVVTEDRVEGPIKVKAFIVRSRAILINDSATSALHIVIIDPKEGIWCFRDELGKRERRGK